MKRSIKSNQREVVILSLIANAAGTALTGLDAAQASLVDTGPGVKTINLNSPLSDLSCIVTTATADTVAQVSITDSDTIVISTFDCTDGTTAKDAICHILIIGSNVSDRV